MAEVTGWSLESLERMGRDDPARLFAFRRYYVERGRAQEAHVRAVESAQSAPRQTRQPGGDVANRALALAAEHEASVLG